MTENEIRTVRSLVCEACVAAVEQEMLRMDWRLLDGFVSEFLRLVVQMNRSG